MADTASLFVHLLLGGSDEPDDDLWTWRICVCVLGFGIFLLEDFEVWGGSLIMWSRPLLCCLTSFIGKHNCGSFFGKKSTMLIAMRLMMIKKVGHLYCSRLRLLPLNSSIPMFLCLRLCFYVVALKRGWFWQYLWFWRAKLPKMSQQDNCPSF